jgi:uncharacterized metal-binding protein YceD (DUF177 family)
MKIPVTDLQENEGLTLIGTLDPAPYELDCGQGETWLGIDYDLQAARLGEECLVTGHLMAKLTVICARCAEPLPYQIQVPDFQHTLEIKNEEPIDLTPMIREDIILCFPIAASCPLEAGNKCSHSGVVLKENDPAFADKRRDDIWGPLEKLKKKEDHGNA